MQDSSNGNDKHAKLSEVDARNKSGAGYYEFFLTRTPEGLMCRIGLADYCGYTMQFLMYRSHSNGTKSFAETSNLFRNIGDIIVAVNGFDIRGWTFDEAIRFIVDQSSAQHGVYIRALDISYVGLNKLDSTTVSHVLNSPDSKDQHDYHLAGESLRTTSPAYAEDEKEDEIVDDPTVTTPTITDAISQLPLCPVEALQDKQRNVQIKNGGEVERKRKYSFVSYFLDQLEQSDEEYSRPESPTANVNVSGTKFCKFFLDQLENEQKKTWSKS